MNRKIEFVYPNKTQAISLTGFKCALNCKHCGAHYLRCMKTVQDIPHLTDKKSLLISGGSTKTGRVPIEESLPLLEKLKNDGYRLNLHTGFPQKKSIKQIKALADCVSFDFLLDDETIKTVYGLDRKGAQYYETLKLMLDKGINVIPHVTIGILGGKIKGEYDALKSLKELNCKEVVLLIFVPTKGTFYENCSPVPVPDIEKIFYFTKKILQNKKITLGCLRPQGNYRYLTDIIAISNYFDKIVMPHGKAREYAIERHMEIIEKEECCALG